ncbi:MAG TPA: YicC/YloC family endoribonuclease [Candidatus Polarisedimenticolia bacterium]|nr:YicC/YloC family endoribonuclease [Candidatus Polarisedimenticolia bacterium]
MTGYGRGEAMMNGLRLTAEVRSVNHRFCELSVRLPRALSSLEAEARKLLTERLTRGKISLTVSWGGEGEHQAEPSATLRLDQNAAERYVALLRELKQKYGLAGEIDLRSLASLPNLFVWEEPASDTDAYVAMLRDVVTKAAADLIKMKELEGETLRTDLEARVESIRSRVAQIRERAPDRLHDARNRLRERVNLLLEKGEIPEERVAQEVAILSDRLDCTEECVRLEAHCDHFRKLLEEESTPGRKLNFLLQEMNREINTIGSKSSDVPIVDQVVEVKEELERIREQVQNIE